MITNWDLTNIYPHDEDFEKEIVRLKEILTPEIASLAGKLGTIDGFKKYLDLSLDVESSISRAFVYASTRSDLDKRNVKNGEALMRIQLAYQDFASAASFADPEILSLGKDYVFSFLKKHKEYEQFDFTFEKLFREADHVLSADKEKLLSAYAPLTNKGADLYSSLAVADGKEHEATLLDGRKVKVSQNNWVSLVENEKNQEDRERIFKALYEGFEEHKNTFGEIYNSTLQGELAVMKTRGYSSILEEHLYGNNIPLDVFKNLVDVASNNAAPLHKYYQIRAKYLGLKKHRSFDRFVPLARSEKKYSYEDALKLFYESIKGYSEDYQKKAHEVTKEGYVDVYPILGKRSGAYSTGGNGVHPYILLNFNGTLDDVFTLAHESGHSVHTLYSDEAEPTMKQSYTIFVAEIASTFNEHNLLDYLLTYTSLDRNTKIALLQKAIDEIVATFYRQTLFGQYEYEISKLVENGTPINHEVLSKEMVKLYETYYGIDIREEGVKPLVWAYIPHLFYTPFYVYQYATSFTASMLLYENFKDKKPGAFDNFVNLLKSGGSDYPVTLVKKAGVDLTKKETFYCVTKRMEELVNELERVLFND